ncbi:MAG: DNA polymerase III subunit delta [Phycisphaerales bacterium]|nr:DNA polymerase III subunit delta [Phycisphaerales bacterium]
MATLKADMPVVVLAGQDDYLVPHWTRRLVEVLEEAHGEIERFDFDGERTSAADVLDELRSLGLLQPHKLVVVDKADVFLAAAKGQRNGARQLLEKYVQAPCEASTLLLRAGTWRKSKLDGMIESGGGEVIKIKPLSEADTLRWIHARADKEYAATVSADAATRLVRRCGTVLARLDAELAKLAAMGEGAIDVELVDAHVPMSREEKAWVIQDALLTGGAAAALEVLHGLLSVSRQSDVLIAWAITDMVRRMHAASAMHRSGSRPGDIRKALKLWGNSGDATVHLAARMEPGQLAALLDRCLSSQARVRRGVGRPERALERLVIDVGRVVAA